MHEQKLTFRKCIHELLIFVRPYRLKLSIALLMVVVTNLTFALNPMMEGKITTQLASDGADILKGVPGAHVQFPILFRFMGVLLVLYLIKTVSQLITSFFLTDAIQKTMYDIRNALQKKIQKLPVKYFDDHAFGDILSSVTNDVDTLSNALQQTLSRVFAAILTFLFVIIMMFSINVWMALTALLIIPLTALITFGFVKHSQKMFDLQQEMVGELNGTITELYSGFNEILLFNRQKDSCRRFSDVNQKMADAAFKAQFLSSLISPFVSLVTYLTIGSIAVMGSFFVINGTVTVGNLQAFIRYIWQINDPLSQVSQLSSQVQSAYSAMNRIFTLLKEEEEVQTGNTAFHMENMSGNVSFEHVQFGYEEELLMKDVSFQVKAGQMVAIVGPTGAGKTTLMNLLLRFYDVKGGAVKIDGIDIRDMDRHDLRSLFSLVLQDTWLFSGSIFENIRYGSLNARKDEVVDAAKMANIHHYISTLSHGYDSLINEESNNISQGEKQLLTIARAVLKNPRILILDEATSAVDTRIEKMLQEAMQKVMKGRTSFVIAHRLSTIRNADLILVVDNGDIIEQGTHDELLKKHGAYHRLYHSQFANQELAGAEE